jgi:ferredoxin-NADP reductase
MEAGYRIRSQPEYKGLSWQDHATAHLILAQGAGAKTVINMLHQQHSDQPITLLYAHQSHEDINYVSELKALLHADQHVFDDEKITLKALKLLLPFMFMGTRVYVAGSQEFIWAVADAVKAFGIDDADIIKELSGTQARSVYCVHCKAITHHATNNITECIGCQRMLFVRDHFSRNLGAYMGLMVDAEDPGALPEIEEIYP